MLANNKFTASYSVTSSVLGLFDKLVPVHASITGNIRQTAGGNNFAEPVPYIWWVELEMSELAISLSRVSHATFQTVFFNVYRVMWSWILSLPLFTLVQGLKIGSYQTHLIIHCWPKNFDPNYIYNFTWIFECVQASLRTPAGFHCVCGCNYCSFYPRTIGTEKATYTGLVCC